jgi:hypothetical protein
VDTGRSTRLFPWVSILLLALFVLFGAGDKVQAKPTVSVLATDPPGTNVVLGRNQNFSMHLRYESDQPIRIWVQPYFQGKPVDAGSNPSREYAAGSGEAIGWFFLFQEGARVDEIRIRAGDGSTRGTSVVATYPVEITASGQAPEKRSGVDWVNRLNALNAAAQREDYEKRMNTPVTAEDTMLFSGFFLAVLGIGLLGFAAPAWAVWKWRGGWRIAAAFPAAMMAFVVLRIVVDGTMDPTSHNLWPFEILMAGAASTGFVFLAGLLRKIAGSNRPS